MDKLIGEVMNKLIQTAFLFALTALVAFGQITGEVRGLVLDASGAAMSGAKVQVINPATGETRSLITGAEGRFNAPLCRLAIMMSRPNLRASAR